MAASTMQNFKWREDIKKHVNVGHIFKPTAHSKEEWEISGAHNSHNFARHAGLMSACLYKQETPADTAGTEEPLFKIKYRPSENTSNGYLIKSLFNPQLFTADKLDELAKQAYKDFLKTKYLQYARDHPFQWFGKAVADREVIWFGGRYEFAPEGTTRVMTYYPQSIYPLQ